MIQLLPLGAWTEFRGASERKGQNHTTHQAVITDAGGQQHKCYVKASPPGFPMPFAEALAWLVADALDLPRPTFAALVEISIPELRKHMALDQHWMQHATVLAFCCSAVDGKHINSAWRWLERMRTAKALLHEDVARIAAFDMWVENQDRHTGNFLRTKAGDYVPIDNELILYSLLWLANGFSYAHNSLVAQAHATLKTPGYTKFEVSMVLASKHHEAAFRKVTPALQQFVAALIADPAQAAATTTAILQFLAQRAHPDWLAIKLGRIP